MAKLKINSTEYLLTTSKLTSPALKLVLGGSTFYGYLQSTKPPTVTLQVGSKYLALPKVPFNITLPISLISYDGDTVYSSYLTQLNAFSATWSFSGQCRQDDNDWLEYSGNHGGVWGGSTKIYDMGHDHERDTGWKSVSGGGTLKTHTETPTTVSQRMRFDGVLIDSEGHEPDSYLTGTLTITGWKLAT